MENKIEIFTDVLVLLFVLYTLCFGIGGLTFKILLSTPSYPITFPLFYALTLFGSFLGIYTLYRRKGTIESFYSPDLTKSVITVLLFLLLVPVIMVPVVGFQVCLEMGGCEGGKTLAFSPILSISKYGSYSFNLDKILRSWYISLPGLLFYLLVFYRISTALELKLKEVENYISKHPLLGNFSMNEFNRNCLSFMSSQACGRCCRWSCQLEEAIWSRLRAKEEIVKLTISFNAAIMFSCCG